MTKKKIILSVFFSIICVLCCCLFVPNDIMPVYAYSVSGNETDTYSFSSSGESSSAYWQNCGGVQSENKLCTGSNIKIKYDKKSTSTNNVNVYQEVKSVTVSTNSLPGWLTGITSGHNFGEGKLYVEIWKDGTHQETFEKSLGTSSSSTIDLSGLTDKYSYYSFRVVYLYRVHWWSWGNTGNKYIHYLSQDFKVQTQNVGAKFTKSVYDVNSKTYTNSIVNGGTYKTDNTNMHFQWNYANYDNNTEDTVNVYGYILYSDGKTVVSGFSSTNNGKAGHHLLGLSNGTYVCEIQAELGKTFRYNLIIEPFDPLLTIESGVRKDNVYCIEYQSKISWTDTASVKNVKINNTVINNGDIIKPGERNIQWGVEYKIIVTRTTEATEEYTVVFTNKEQVDLNANQDSLTKSPIGRWYETYLQESEDKIYNSWASYNNALIFAIERENDTVTQAYYDGGAWTAGIGMDDPLNKKEGYYYIYKKRDDAGEKNAYFTKEALDSAILEYAKASITNNTYFSKSAPAIPHENEEVYKTKTVNGLKSNLFLLGEFELSKRPYVDLWVNGNLIDFGYNQTIKFDTPGTYEIEEINPFGDKVTYYIYIQNCAPEIEYTMKGTSLKSVLSDTNTRFGDFFDLTLFDLDDDSLLVISSPSAINQDTFTYTYKELIEILNSDKTTNNFLFNKSGKYKVTAINHWTRFAHIPVREFEFYVSVNEPYINDPSVNKEKNELTLSFGIPTGESNTQIVTVDIKKYNINDGTWVTLTHDSKGVEITPETFSYIFNTQGYYVITIIDNFGRELSREYAFSREKPSAILTVGNVQEELSEEQIGYFNKKVTITWYDNTITAKMYGVAYSWNEDGVMIKQNLNASDYISGTSITSEGYYIIELLDIDYNSRRFTFFIDQKAPTLNLSANDKTFESGGYKNSDVSATYQSESEYETPISISVTQNTFPISYPENGLFVEEGTYKITLIDGAGNSSSYEFTIDKTAPEGQLFLEDGTEFTQNGITNKGVYCTWVEDGITAICNENVYYKGSVLSTRNEENYRITLTDKAGNTSVYTFKISQNIPIVVMRTTSGKTIANNTTVDESFIISWEDPNYTYKIEIVRNGQASAFTRYTEMSARMFKFEESGSYRFTFTNAINNTYIYSVNANMRPSAIITAGVENLPAYEYTNKNVTVTISDRNSIVEVYKLDENNDYKTYSNWSLDGFNFTIIEDGSYKIVIRNDFDLSNNYFFSIKTSLPVASLTGSAGEELKSGDEILGTVKVNYNKDEVEEFKVYLNGEIYYGETEEFSEVGRYIIYLTDKAGNQSSYSFEIVASDDLNWAGIVTLVAMFTALIGVGIFLFLKFKRPFKLK
ncbi:MAG: hypothetical protein IKA31_02910 [Clostridia bacterium]|nr:hypothetical protein [Clostridia bacterium]